MLLRFFRCLGFSSSSPADFSSVLSDSAYSALLFVSFRPSLLHSHSRSTSACLLSGFFRPLTSGIRFFPLTFFRPLSFQIYQLLRFLAFPFRFFLLPPRASFHSARSLLSSLPFSPSVLPGFPFISSGSAYSVLCLVSFRPSRLRSRSCSIGAYRFPGFFRPLCFGIRPLLPFSFGSCSL